MRRISFLLLLFYCQNITGQINNLRFKHLTPNEGLSSSSVNCILQDNHGFIWIGTNDGLNKFDGHNFEVFKNEPKDTTSLNSSSVFSLYLDEEGTLWIGTSRGVNVYDRETNTFIRKPEFPNLKIFAISKDNNGNFLIGSQNLYVLYKDKQKLVEYFPDIKNKESISNGNVTEIFIDKKNRIWVGTAFGLNLFDAKKGSFKHFFSKKNDENCLNSNSICALAADQDNVMWVGTVKGLNELHVIDNYADSVIIKSYEHNPFDPNSIPEGFITSLYCDKQNNLWIGSRNGGLSILELDKQQSGPYSFLRYIYDEYSPYGINSNSINYIYGDCSGNVWIGTYSGGINLYFKDAKKFRLYNYSPKLFKSINNNRVNVFLEDDKYIWIGTEGGLNQYNKETETYKYFTHDKNDPYSIGSNAVWALAKDKKGRLWVGTWAGGLNLFDAKSQKFIRYQAEPSNKKSINTNHVFSIFPDEDNNLWIGTMGGGLNYFDTKKNEFIHYTSRNSSITTNFVEQIVENSKNQLILANVNGISIFDKKSKLFTPFPLPDTHQINENYPYVPTLLIDSKNNLWLGTEVGLFVVSPDHKKANHYTSADGLLNNAVKSILEDEKGNLWMGTNEGISKLIDAVTIPSEPKFRNYTIQDGLQGKEFNRRACLRTNNGFMYFGGFNGYNVFFPDSIYSNPQKSTVIITDFLLFNSSVRSGTADSPLKKHISETKELILNTKQNSFGLKFVSINYLSPEKQRYAYKLEGFDTYWNYIGTKKEANYTNISPGDYEFMVRVDNGTGEWNDPPTSIRITILPPFWRTVWAYSIYVTIFILILFFYRRFTIIRINTKNQLVIEHLKFSKQEEIHQAKLHFFTNLSHEIRTPLSLINGPVEELLKDKKTSKRTKQQLALAHENLKRLLSLVNQLLDFRKIEEGNESLHVSYHNITELINKIINAFKYQKGLKKIKFDFKNKEKQIYMWFDYEKITTVLYNLISNAVKYTPEFGTIDIEMFTVKQTLENNRKILGKSFLRSNRITLDLLEIRIKDQGIGIPKNQLDKIFDRYYQVLNPQLNKNLTGTGIGLNISKQYVELHQGKIWAESIIGRGSCFFIQIPMNREHLNPSQIVTEPKIKGFEEINELIKQEHIVIKLTENKHVELEEINHSNKATILIIDDDIDLLNFLESRLLSNYSIIKAQTGKDGIELANKYLPDIIIADIMMPEMDGLTMTKTIKGNINTSHIPMILLTAKAYDENIIEGIDKGADAYITKPFNFEVLRAYLITMLESRKKLREKYTRQIKLEPEDVTIDSIDGDFLKNMMQIIESNISDSEFSVNDLSEDMNMSYRTLVRKTKVLTNQSVNEFIRTIRLKKAAILLTKDNLPIIEVSTMTGFSDPAYFSRCFRNQFGVSPSQYANMEGKEDIENEFNDSKDKLISTSSN